MLDAPDEFIVYVVLHFVLALDRVLSLSTPSVHKCRMFLQFNLKCKSVLHLFTEGVDG